jgi:hypothetical protein
MKGLAYGVTPDSWIPLDENNQLLVGQAFTALATQQETGAVKVAFDFR